jgi:hypothetical protein
VVLSEPFPRSPAKSLLEKVHGTFGTIRESGKAQYIRSLQSTSPAPALHKYIPINIKPEMHAPGRSAVVTAEGIASLPAFDGIHKRSKPKSATTVPASHLHLCTHNQAHFFNPSVAGLKILYVSHFRALPVKPPIKDGDRIDPLAFTPQLSISPTINSNAARPDYLSYTYTCHIAFSTHGGP